MLPFQVEQLAVPHSRIQSQLHHPPDILIVILINRLQKRFGLIARKIFSPDIVDLGHFDVENGRGWIRTQPLLGSKINKALEQGQNQLDGLRGLLLLLQQPRTKRIEIRSRQLIWSLLAEFRLQIFREPALVWSQSLVVDLQNQCLAAMS